MTQFNVCKLVTIKLVALRKSFSLCSIFVAIPFFFCRIFGGCSIHSLELQKARKNIILVPPWLVPPISLHPMFIVFWLQQLIKILCDTSQAPFTFIWLHYTSGFVVRPSCLLSSHLLHSVIYRSKPAKDDNDKMDLSRKGRKSVIVFVCAFVTAINCRLNQTMQTCWMIPNNFLSVALTEGKSAKVEFQIYTSLFVPSRPVCKKIPMETDKHKT